ncbi:MAG: rRNA maturation RNase YbeY [Cyanobacteria bacterium J06635_15]
MEHSTRARIKTSSQCQVEVLVQFAGIKDWRDRVPTKSTWQSWFESWVNAMAVTLSPINQYALSLQLTTDHQIQQWNAQYRDRDQPTDVLAFAALETTGHQFPELLEAEPLYLGDLVISLETAQRQAESQGHDLTQELMWLATHGLLHLLGWDHLDDHDLAQMLEQQAQLIKQTVLLGVSE